MLGYLREPDVQHPLFCSRSVQINWQIEIKIAFVSNRGQVWRMWLSVSQVDLPMLDPNEENDPLEEQNKVLPLCEQLSPKRNMGGTDLSTSRYIRQLRDSISLGNV